MRFKHLNFHERKMSLEDISAIFPLNIKILLSIYVCMLSWSVMSDFLRPHGLQSTKLLCPWNFPGQKSTGGGFYFLLQGICLTQGLSPQLQHLLYWQMDSSPQSHLGSPQVDIVGLFTDIILKIGPSSAFLSHLERVCRLLPVMSNMVL